MPVRLMGGTRWWVLLKSETWDAENLFFGSSAPDKRVFWQLPLRFRSILHYVPPISRTSIMCRSPLLLFVGSGISKGKHWELVLIFSCKFWKFDRYLSYGRAFVRWFPSEIPWKSACKKVKMPGKPHFWGILRSGSLTHWEGVSALGIFWKNAQLPGLKHEKNSF